MNIALIIKSIEWKMGRYGVLYGLIGKLNLFSIDTGSSTYILHHHIPGYKQGIESETEAGAKAKAEKILHAFIREVVIIQEKS